MVTLSEIMIWWYSSLHNFHMMCGNDGVIKKASDTKKLGRIIKIFEGMVQNK